MIRSSDFASGAGRRETVNPDDFAEVDDYSLKAGVEVSLFGDSLDLLVSQVPAMLAECQDTGVREHRWSLGVLNGLQAGLSPNVR